MGPYTVRPAALLVWWIQDQHDVPQNYNYYLSQGAAEAARKRYRRYKLRVVPQARLVWTIVPPPPSARAHYVTKESADADADRANTGLSLAHDPTQRTYYPCEACGHDWGLHAADGTCPPRTSAYTRYDTSYEQLAASVQTHGYAGPLGPLFAPHQRYPDRAARGEGGDTDGRI